MRAKHVAAPFFALLLVTSAIVAGPTGYVGTAQATHNCEFSDSLIFSISNSITGNNPSGCKLFHGDTDATAGVDNAETKSNIVAAGAGSFDHVRTYITTTKNTVNSSAPVARAEGLAAAYRALENGSTETQVKAAAKEAVRDYYATIQRNALKSWNTMAVNMLNYESMEDTEGLPDDFVGWGYGDPVSRHEISDAGNYSATLVNGETQTVTEISASDPDGSASTETMSPIASRQSVAGVNAPEIARYNSTYQTLRDADTVAPGAYWDVMAWADAQSADVTASMDTYVSQVYTSYEQGTINATEIAGPNALAEEFSAEGDFQSWAVIRLSQMRGASPPNNLSQTGYFRVDAGLNTYEGILLSGENPPSGQFEVGNTYDSANLSGGQYIVTNESTRELTGQWSLEAITDDKGNQLQNSSIQSINYSVANTSDYKELVNEMDTLRAELNAREEATAGGGGLLGGTFGTVGQMAAIAVVGAGGLWALNSGALGGGGSGGGGTTINYSDRVRSRRDKKRED